MVGTVKQFKDMIEEMRSIYPFDDEKAYMSTYNLVTHENSRLQIQVKDEKTGVLIVMEKHVPDIQF